MVQNLTHIPSTMTSIEIAMPPAETGLQKIKKIVGSIFSPQAIKTRLVLLNREKVEEIISQFPEEEDVLRQDVIRRFGRMNGKAISEDSNWLAIQDDLFEAVFKINTDEGARQILSEGLGYSRELLTEVMHCVGRGQQFEAKQSN